jgi:DNA polymerase-3 subunit gamma/tau
MAAEMVLIRLAYAAALPSGEELARLAREGEAKPAPAPPARPAETTRQQQAEPPSPVPVSGSLAIKPEQSRQEIGRTEAAAANPTLASFRDIVALVGDKRDIKLKNQLETLVRPIRVSPGQIELALEPSAPPGLPGELARKLEGWTGSRWMVLVAREGGDKPLAVQARDDRDTLFREMRAHPDVQAVLKRFPGAEIMDVRDPDPVGDDLNPEKDDAP